MITFQNNTIRCKKLLIITSGQKNVTRPFMKRKKASTNVANLQQNSILHHNDYLAVLALTCFCLTNWRVTFFRQETTVASFLNMVLFCKVVINHTSKCQFVMLLCCTRMALLWTTLLGDSHSVANSPLLWFNARLKLVADGISFYGRNRNRKPKL